MSQVSGTETDKVVDGMRAGAIVHLRFLVYQRRVIFP
jgi:hypothetical protein